MEKGARLKRLIKFVINALIFLAPFAVSFFSGRTLFPEDNQSSTYGFERALAFVTIRGAPGHHSPRAKSKWVIDQSERALYGCYVIKMLLQRQRRCLNCLIKTCFILSVLWHCSFYVIYFLISFLPRTKTSKGDTYLKKLHYLTNYCNPYP